MPYTLNPHLPKVRAKAVDLVRLEGWSMRATARYIGVHPATISKWMKRAPKCQTRAIETRSSRPHTSPGRINTDIEQRIVELRLTRGRCAQVIHAQLLLEGYLVSESTVKRVLRRKGMVKPRSPWKKYHLSGERPKAEKPGSLVETDTIHIMQTRHDRVYIYTLIDCFSRWAFARATDRLSAKGALMFINRAQELAPFSFTCLQSDHGPEFSTSFTTYVQAQGIKHRHTRVRQPNDNAHVERFNRTIQDEMRTEIQRFKTNPRRLNREISEYLKYYNNDRLHMGLEFKTPAQVLPRS
jgi:transposase InsO family protein